MNNDKTMKVNKEKGNPTLRCQITDDQIHQLNSIDFIWDLQEYNWNKNFNALKKFKEKNGYCMDPKTTYIHKIKHKDGEEEMLNLGTWCVTQRCTKSRQLQQNKFSSILI